VSPLPVAIFFYIEILISSSRQRQKLSHTSLLSEVITQLSSNFKPDVHMLKKRIEDLIAREYLERVEDAAQPTYRYLA